MQIFSLMEQIDLILFMPCPGLRRHFTVNSFFYLKCLNFNWLVEKKPRLIIGRAHFPHRNKVWQMPSLNMGFHRRGAICWRSLSKRHSACGREGGGGNWCASLLATVFGEEGGRAHGLYSTRSSISLFIFWQIFDGTRKWYDKKRSAWKPNSYIRKKAHLSTKRFFL